MNYTTTKHSFIRSFLTKLIALVIPAFLIPSIAYPFKIDMHVWVAQQVLNDVVDDGMITLDSFGPIRVDPLIVQALRDHPSAYRMGSIGPDGFPDLAGGQMTVHPGVVGGWATDQWLAWMLQGSRTPRQRAFAFGYLTHAASDVFAHSYVNTYTGDFFDLMDGQEAELRHMALEEYMRVHMPPIKDNNGATLEAYNIVDTPAAFLRDQLILNPTVAAQYRKDPFTLYLASMYEYWKTIGEVADEIHAIRSDAKGVINTIQNSIEDIQDEIDSKKNISVTIWGKTFKLYPAYCFIDPGTCSIILALEATLETTKQSLEIPKQIHDGILYSVQAPLEAWQGEVEEALKQYMITSGEIAIELMKPKWPEDVEKSCFDSRYSSPKCKLDAWVCEWTPVFAGIPNEAAVPACSVGDALGRAKKLQQDVFNGISEVRLKFADKFGLLGWAVDPLIKIEQLIDDRIKPEFKDLATDIEHALLTNIAGEKSVTLDLLTMRTEEQTSEKLNELFSEDSSGKGLLIIPDIAERVMWEMHPNGDYWDPQKYNVVYNAVVLSKLLLLGSGQLNSLVKRAGVGDTIYGPDLYDRNTFVNILVGSIASIDGNHQWQEVAPPSPRQQGFTDLKDEDMRRYGYSFDGQKGFRLWQDCHVREKVFTKLFQGPLAPGIENPDLDDLKRFSNLLQEGDENLIRVGDTYYPFPLSSGSNLPLKIRDQHTFSLADYLAADGNLLALWQSQGVERLAGHSVARLELPWSIGARNLLFDLNSNVCGGHKGDVISTEWAFTDRCDYQCSCTQGLYGFPTCNCTADTCEPLQFHWLEEIQASMSHEFKAGVDDCEVCHNDSGGLLAGELNLVLNSVPESTIQPDPPNEQGVEYSGSLICNTGESATTLVMPAVATNTVRVTITNPESGQSIIRETQYQTDNENIRDLFPHWSEVDQAIRSSSAGRESACGLVSLTSEEELPADITAPSISPPPDVIITCNEFIAGISSGQAVADFLGEPLVQDDRDGAPEVSSNAPETLSPGEIVVYWTATDSSGNANTTQQLVTLVDTEAPVFIGEMDLITAQSQGGYTAVPLMPPVAYDACEGEIIAGTDTDLSSFFIGPTEVIWRSSDSSGNTAEARQMVIVEGIPGDVNGDGLVTQADLEIILESLGQTSMAVVELSDFDGDGDIDQADSELFALILNGGGDPRDLNNDGVISLSDALELVQNFCTHSCVLATDQGYSTSEDTPVTTDAPTVLGSLGASVFTTLLDTEASHGAVTINTDGSFTYSPNKDYNGPDSFTYHIGNGSLSSNIATISVTVVPVNDPPVVKIDLENQTVQYSDEITPVLITATDIDSTALTISVSGEPSSLALNLDDCFDEGQGTICTWTLSGKVTEGKNVYLPAFEIGDTETTTVESAEITVIPESASITFDSQNPLAVQVNSEGSDSSTAFSIELRISESEPDSASSGKPLAGEISHATVQTKLSPVGPGSTVAPLECTEILSGDGYDGTKAVNCLFEDVPVNTYSIEVSVSGDYYSASGEDVVSVVDPSLGFTSGGGWFFWPESGDKTNFGFTMKYNKKATKVQGSFLLIRHLADGKKYRLKSNALAGLSLGNTASGSPPWATVIGKATYLEPGWADSIGNHGFILYVEDNGTVGSGDDRIWLESTNREGTPVPALSLPRPASDNAIDIRGGNIVVPH